VKPCCDIWTVFDEKNLVIKEYASWKLLVRNRNTTLGNCVAITKRHLESFSDISPGEMAEFALVVKDAERVLKHAFSYDKINYLMLMMKDKHTHFHIIPRYSGPRDFAGMTWNDEGWPAMPGGQKEALSPEILYLIKAEIQNHL